MAPAIANAPNAANTINGNWLAVRGSCPLRREPDVPVAAPAVCDWLLD